MPRDLALGYARVYPPNAPAGALSPQLEAALARREDDGQPKRRRLVGRWCPCHGGREYEVHES